MFRLSFWTNTPNFISVSKLCNNLQFLKCYIFSPKHHFYSTKLTQDRVSIICNLLPIVPNLIKVGGVAHDNEQHNILKYFLWATIPLKKKYFPCFKPETTPVLQKRRWLIRPVCSLQIHGLWNSQQNKKVVEHWTMHVVQSKTGKSRSNILREFERCERIAIKAGKTSRQQTTS